MLRKALWTSTPHASPTQPPESWYRAGTPSNCPALVKHFPYQTYRWYRKESSVSVAPVRLGHRREMVGGTLILRNAEIRDSGRYVCVLTSSGNEDKAETELVVTGNIDKWFCVLRSVLVLDFKMMNENLYWCLL
ncbi:ig-like domain-containing protein [Trichonephila clavata]|uniref:Ig-like domain-containing protein n=1 Tax=Trichonephila clavata TaxID=2740835 RepID=A0A8X6FLP6_TRICU|nr:ig-like domain-containing protein [Trichonephila clavata]